MTNENEAQISSLVFYSEEVPKMVEFYQKLGIDFVGEQHGSGPKHFSAQLNNNLLFEIYPGTKPPRLGFKVRSVEEIVNKLTDRENYTNQPVRESLFGRYTTFKDPTGATIELREPPI